MLGNAVPTGRLGTLGAGVVGVDGGDEEARIGQGEHLAFAERPDEERVFALVNLGERAFLPEALAIAESIAGEPSMGARRMRVEPGLFANRVVEVEV